MPSLPPKRQLLAAVAAALSLPAVAVTASVAKNSVQPPALREIVEQIGVAPELVGPLDGDAILVSAESIGRSDSLLDALRRAGVMDADAERFIRQSRVAKPLFNAGPGSFVRIARSTSGALRELEVNVSGGSAWRLRRNGDKFDLDRNTAVGQASVQARSGAGGPSLFRAFADAGVPRGVADQVVRIFSRQFDLHAAAKEIERFAVVYEEQRTSAEPRPGRVLGAEVVRNGKVHRAFWFSAGGGRGGDYYGPEGFSLDREFLPAPLEFTEVTSAFGVSRQIGSRYQESHGGIDYAAPEGTPVHATADGVVEFAGIQRGYGNVIVVKHREPLATLYAHLSAFAPSVTPGFRVRQGELIGFVGRTGWATGPHLHYEMRVADKQVNPEAATVVAAELAKPQRIADFRARTAAVADRLDLVATLTKAGFE
jgi:murein DD-endopeptidase MepM/ murein hydrolase activator NlpD